MAIGRGLGRGPVRNGTGPRARAGLCPVANRGRRVGVVRTKPKSSGTKTGGGSNSDLYSRR